MGEEPVIKPVQDMTPEERKRAAEAHSLKEMLDAVNARARENNREDAEDRKRWR